MVRAEETQGQIQLSTYLPVDNLNFLTDFDLTHDKRLIPKVPDGETQNHDMAEILNQLGIGKTCFLAAYFNKHCCLCLLLCTAASRQLGEIF